MLNVVLFPKTAFLSYSCLNFDQFNMRPLLSSDESDETLLAAVFDKTLTFAVKNVFPVWK